MRDDREPAPRGILTASVLVRIAALNGASLFPRPVDRHTQVAMTQTDQGATPGTELGQLAHELSRLVRHDLELAAAERLPELRRIAAEASVLAVAVVALVLAFAAGTWAAVRGLTPAIPDWAAPLVVAGAWLILAVALLAHGYPRRLLDRFSAGRHHRAIENSRADREQGELEVRQTAERLAQALLREAEAQGLRAAGSVAKRAVGEAEHEAGNLASQIADALLAPGKAGLSILDRLTGSKDEQS